MGESVPPEDAVEGALVEPPPTGVGSAEPEGTVGAGVSPGEELVGVGAMVTGEPPIGLSVGISLEVGAVAGGSGSDGTVGVVIAPDGAGVSTTVGAIVGDKVGCLVGSLLKKSFPTTSRSRGLMSCRLSMASCFSNVDSLKNRSY